MHENIERIFLKVKQTWNVWVGLGALLFAGLLCTLLFLFIWVLTPKNTISGVTSNALVTRLPAPTYTPVVPMTATPTVDGSALDGILFGLEVEIYDTGGAGLRFRSEPGIGADVQFIASDQEVFKVEGGPVEEDGFVWWYLMSTQVSDRRGWAVSTYLRPATLN
ncbi:MAG: hypothetical protein K8R77_10350 [Anaerolineaceae bacterium]|nr:hypothetical protein [Anaerolineaceae bacterium]